MTATACSDCTAFQSCEINRAEWRMARTRYRDNPVGQMRHMDLVFQSCEMKTV